MGKRELHPLTAKIRTVCGFNQAMDDIITRWLSEKAKELARTWLHGGIPIDKCASEIFEVLGLLSNSSEEPVGGYFMINPSEEGKKIMDEINNVKPKPSSEKLVDKLWEHKQYGYCMNHKTIHTFDSGECKEAKECWCMTSDKWNLEWAYCPTCGAGKTQPFKPKELWEKFSEYIKEVGTMLNTRELEKIATAHFRESK